MKIYKHYQFAKWMLKMRLFDEHLKQASNEIMNNLIDADLGQ
ncbi:MAG: type II toxin-antitoxin system RelE/ParE family toxin [Legionellales bacterium]|nr:type II toxin-antitoxin system RelE/ParE family toxin [Legionellales bacterium]